MAQLNTRVKGYILLESILAMVIVMTCFGVAAMIYNNVIGGMRSRLQLQARFELEQEAYRARTQNRLITEQIPHETLLISKSVELYKGAENVYLLKLSAAGKDGKLLAVHRELVRKP
ncbi:MAG: hypothetical protein MUC87_22180 [Bacteroidia bacterium]|jgi:hypothetical protein|nr:hypothetical protein [Bacteroidia bacterium]